MSFAADDAAYADAAAAWRGAYVHVPFCARVCPYCDFAVVAGRDDLHSRYVDALVAEIAMEPEWGPLDAVYVGGGTPSRLPAEALGRVVDVLRARFGLAPGAEISLEANPEDWSDEYADGLLSVGFNRVSLGVQSLDDDVLASLGRMHDAPAAAAAIRGAARSGFRTVNVDLIFGTPGESLASWRATVAATIDLGPDHVSTYALTVERGTELGRAVLAGAPAPDGDDQASKWQHAASVLEGAGLRRYEVSNFATPGHGCRYNLLTWAQGEYLAVGLGAHGHRDRVRRRNVRRLDAYLGRVEAGERPEAGRDDVVGWGREQERLLLGLRRTAGVVAGAGGERLLASAWGARLEAAGVIELDEGRLRVVRPLLTDEPSRAVLALDPPDC